MSMFQYMLGDINAIWARVVSDGSQWGEPHREKPSEESAGMSILNAFYRWVVDRWIIILSKKH